MNVQRSLIWEFLIYEIELRHNTEEATKNISGTKGEGMVDHYSVTRWFKKFRSVCKNLDDQTRLGRPKSLDFEVIESNQASRSWRISGEASISYSCVTHHDVGKSTRSCRIVPHVTKILQFFLFRFVRSGRPKLWISKSRFKPQKQISRNSIKM